MKSPTTQDNSPLEGDIEAIFLKPIAFCSCFALVDLTPVSVAAYDCWQQKRQNPESRSNLAGGLRVQGLSESRGKYSK
jgi:hypothetical protein